MAKITFKAKVQPVQNMDGTFAYNMVQIPALTRSHCDMGAFRQHKKYGGFANSDMFPAMLKRIRSDIGGSAARLRFGAEGYTLPENVSIDTSGFLAKVEIDV
jgi:hypothetical protein